MSLTTKVNTTSAYCSTVPCDVSYFCPSCEHGTGFPDDGMNKNVIIIQSKFMSSVHAAERDDFSTNANDHTVYLQQRQNAPAVLYFLHVM